MKAVKIQKAGGPETLELQDITLRKPVKDEVLIEHVAIGLNYIDTYLPEEYYSQPQYI